MDITAASTERTIHIRICHHLWIRAFNMYIFKIPGFYECPISWVHFKMPQDASKYCNLGRNLWHFVLQMNCHKSDMPQDCLIQGVFSGHLWHNDFS